MSDMWCKKPNVNVDKYQKLNIFRIQKDLSKSKSNPNPFKR